MTTFQSGAKRQLLHDLESQGATILYTDYSEDQQLLKAMTGSDIRQYTNQCLTARIELSHIRL
jgi:hypothetical protein